MKSETPAQTQHTASPSPRYSILDTYEADLLNGTPVGTPDRRETVTEIQDRDEADLLCYANPERAALICRAVNSHAAMVEALREMVFRFDHTAEGSPEDAASLDAARAALKLATEGK